jgi:hypothetical protein
MVVIKQKSLPRLLEEGFLLVSLYLGYTIQLPSSGRCADGANGNNNGVV